MDKVIKDAQLKGERKIFRKVNENLWESIYDAGFSSIDLKEEYKLVAREAEENIFGDVDEPYSSLKLSLLNQLRNLLKIEDFRLPLNDLVDFVLPYI